uniref:Uncharacterized protein n=1 Tax=Hyaloperonospora arabidopsidis (strain Emoy2) TaxID=559515 RepID=M4BUR1_HYAAE
MVNNSMRCAAKADEKAAARVNAAVLDNAQHLAANDASSAAAAKPVAADARSESLRANDDGSQVELIYSGESDGGSDSKKTSRSPESILAAEYEPTNRQVVRTMVTTRVCLVRRTSMLTHPPLLLLRIRLKENAAMTWTVVMMILVVPRLLLVPRRRL